MSRVYVGLKGEEYDSLTELANAYGISYSALYSRLYKFGWTLEDSLTKPVQVRSKVLKIEYNGKTYIGIKDFADDIGLSETYVRNLYVSGMSAEDIVKKRDELFLVAPNGKSYRFLADVARDYGVSIYTLRPAYCHGKVSLEDAIRKAQESTRKPLFIKGIEFRSVSEASKHFGIPLNVFKYRLKQGVSDDDLLKPAASRSFEYKGKTYKTLQEFVEDYGLSYSFTYRRRSLGESLDSIISEHAELMSKSRKKGLK